MKKKKKKVRIKPGCLVSVVVLILGCVVLFLTPLFDIEDIVISGNSRISNAEILIASGIREDHNIFAINKNVAKEKIKALGYIENVKIKRKLPHVVTIEVIEGNVVAYLEFNDLLAGVNKEGQTLCTVDKASGVTGAPIAWGIGVSEAVPGKMIKIADGRLDEYEILVQFLNAFEKYSLTDDITHINITKKTDIIFRYRDKLKIEFGEMNDFDLKFNYFIAMVEEMAENPTGVINMQSENYVYRNTIE